MQIYENINLVRLTIIAFGIASVTSDEEFKCKARPGCHVGSCEPGPMSSIENMDRSEFPITCKSTSESTTDGNSPVPGNVELFLQFLLRFGKETDTLEKEIELVKMKTSQDLLQTKSELEVSITNLTRRSVTLVEEMHLFMNETHRYLRESESALENSIISSTREAVVEVMTEIDLVKNRTSLHILQIKSDLENSITNLTRRLEGFFRESTTAIETLRQENMKLEQEYDASRTKWSQLYEMEAFTTRENTNKVKELTKAFETMRQENAVLKEELTKAFETMRQETAELKQDFEEVMLGRKDNTIILKRVENEISKLKSAITCDRKEFTDPQHYNATFCPAGKIVGSTCNIKCESGYRLNTNLSTWTASCNVNTGGNTLAEWDFVKEPYCEELSCYRRNLQKYSNLNAALCPYRADLDSKCLLSCEKGYRLRDNRANFTATCGLDSMDSSMAKWIVEERCIAIRCTGWTIGPHQELHPKHCSGRQKVGSVCRIQCKVNFRFVNVSAKSIQGKCRLNGSSVSASWDRKRVPDCEAIRCARKFFWKSSNYMTDYCPSGTVVGSKCLIVCKTGYKFNDNTTSQMASCKLIAGNKSHAEWDFTDVPKCKAIRCTGWALGLHQELHPQHCSGRQKVGSVCRIQCKENYRFVNVSEKYIQGKCQLNVSSVSASWDRTRIPHCEAIRCIGWTLGLHQEVYPKHCSGRQKVGSVCRIQCKANFRFINVSENYIQGKCSLNSSSVSASWDRTRIPDCEAIRCARKSFWKSTESCPSGMVVGSKCLIVCQTGYKFSDNTTSQMASCKLKAGNQSHAEWDFSTVPKCEEIVCKSWELKRHQVLVSGDCLSSYRFDSACVIRCAKKFRFESSQLSSISTRCIMNDDMISASWTTSPIPHCIERCPRTTFIGGMGGVITSPRYPDYYENNACFHWNVTVPVGKVIMIESPTTFDLESSQHCQLDALSLDGYGRFCGKIPFSPFKTVSNSLFATFTTNANVTRAGFSFRWSAIAIMCERKAVFQEHYKTKLCPGGKTVGSVCSVACKKGYRFSILTATFPFLCELMPGSQSSAEWNLENAPKCVPITYERKKLIHPQHCNTTFCPRGKDFNSPCTLKCDRGYRFSPHSVIWKVYPTLKANSNVRAEWNFAHVPRCKEITCNKKDFPKEARLNITLCSNGMSQGSVCTFTCLKGYRFDGSVRKSTATCVVDDERPTIAKWKISKPCLDIMCRPLRLRRNQEYANKKCYGRQDVDSVCRVRCKANFKFPMALQNAVKSKCILMENMLFATWRPKTRTPDCIEILCKPFELTRHMKLANGDCVKSRQVNTWCRVRCDANYRFESSENTIMVVRCKLNADRISASWTPIPKCTENCPTPHFINGTTAGVISSPEYPSYYENDFCFTWIITVPDDKVIMIKPATIFDLESTGNEECTFDALIFEGYGRFCGETTFPSFATTTNSLYVTFTTDESIRKAGFSFSWLAVDPDDITHDSTIGIQ